MATYLHNELLPLKDEVLYTIEGNSDTFTHIPPLYPFVNSGSNSVN